MASRRRATPPLDVLPEGLASQVEAAIRAYGAVLLNKLTAAKLSRRAAAELQEKLVLAGLERTGRHLRVPLKEQLCALLEEGGLVPLVGLKSSLPGASTQAEAKQVALALVRQGQACLVLRRGKQSLCRPDADVISAEQIEQLGREIKSLGDALKKAKPKRGQPPPVLLREELSELLQPLAALTAELTAGAEQSGASVEQLVLEAIRALEQADPLVYVPEVARRLAGQLELSELHDVLRAASAAGQLELRPESGIKTLSAEEARLCVPGPQGTLLSYVRRL